MASGKTRSNPPPLLRTVNHDAPWSFLFISLCQHLHITGLLQHRYIILWRLKSRFCPDYSKWDKNMKFGTKMCLGVKNVV